MLNTTNETVDDLLELAREHGINAALYVIDSQHREAMDTAHDQLLPNNDTPRGLSDQQMSDYMDRALAHMNEELKLLATDHAAFRARFIDQTRIAALRAIMATHGLKRGDVARILGLTPRPGGSHGTVDGWLSGVRGMPAAKLELIRMKAPGWKNTRQAV